MESRTFVLSQNSGRPSENHWFPSGFTSIQLQKGYQLEKRRPSHVGTAAETVGKSTIFQQGEPLFLLSPVLLQKECSGLFLGFRRQQTLELWFPMVSKVVPTDFVHPQNEYPQKEHEPNSAFLNDGFEPGKFSMELARCETLERIVLAGLSDGRNRFDSHGGSQPESFGRLLESLEKFGAGFMTDPTKSFQPLSREQRTTQFFHHFVSSNN